MQLFSTEEITAPVETVFAMLADLDHYAQLAEQRGIKAVHRVGSPRQGLGSIWDVVLTLQNKERQIALEITRFDAPFTIHFSIGSSSLAGQISCTLAAPSPDKTQLTVAIEVKPLTLKARLLVQSIQLTKGTLDRKYAERISELAADLQSRCPQA